MAVLTVLPTYGKYELKIGEDPIDVSEWDGNLYVFSDITEYATKMNAGGWYIDKKVILRIDNEDENNSVRFYGGEFPVAYTKNLIFGGGVLLDVGSGCTFEIAGTGQVASGYRSSSDHPTYNTTDNTINLYGTIKASGNYSARGHLFYAYATSGSISDCFVSGTLNIFQGGTLDAESGDGTLVVSEAYGSAELVTSINVYEGGLIKAGKDKLRIGFIGTSSSLVNTIATTVLTLDGGRMDVEDGHTSNKEIDYNSIGLCAAAGATTDTTIKVLNGGKFYGGNIEISRSDSNSGANTNLRIIVDGKGSEFSTNGNISVNEIQNHPINHPEKKYIRKNTEIQIANGGKMIFGGSYLGAQTTTFYSSDFVELHFSTRIIIDDGGILVIKGKGGFIGVFDSLLKSLENKPDNEEAQATLAATERDTIFELHGNSTLDVSEYTVNASRDSWQGIWGDLLVGGGQIILGENNAAQTGDSVLLRKNVIIQTDKDYHGTVDLGGLDASKISPEFTFKHYQEWDEERGEFVKRDTRNGFRIGGANTRITGLKAGSTLTLRNVGTNSITVGTGSAYLTTGGGEAPEGYAALIEFEDNDGTVELGSGAEITLNFDGKFVDGIFSGAEDGKVQIEVWFTNGSLTLGEGDGVPNDFFKIGDGWGLYAATVTGPEGETPGKLLITGDISNVWASTQKLQPNESGAYSGDLDDGVSKATKVVIDGDTELKSTTGGTLEQLEGDHNLHITGEGEVNLDNTPSAFPTGTPDSTFKGLLTADKGVNLHKTGEGTLTLDGGLKAGGDVTVEEGALVLGEGSESSISGTLDVSGTLEVDGTLTLSGTSDLSGSKGSITGSGTLVLDGDITFGDEFDLDQNLTIEMGEGADNVNFGTHEATLGNLTGDETITGKNLIVSNEEGQVFSGTLSGQAKVEDNFSVSGMNADGCDFTMQDNSALDLTQGGNNTLGSVKSADDAGATYKLQDTSTNNKIGDFVIHTEDTVDIGLHLDDEAFWGESGAVENPGMLTCTGTLVIENGATFRIHNLSDIIAEHSGKSLKGIIIMSGKDVYTAASYMGDDDKSRQLASGELEARVRLDNVLKGIFKSARIVFTNADAAEAVALDVQPREARKNPKDLVLDMETYSAADIRESAGSQVAYAGGMLLNHHVSEHHLNSDPDVLKVTTAIGSVIDSNHAEANRIRAAVAGSTLTSLSAAQSAALRNQMGRVRDHALQAARLRCAGNADEATAQQRPCKNSHVWVEGTSFFSEQHSVGDESGYRLNSWGGAVGIDAQVDAHWSVGVSLSASYGDLEARAADYAKGDLDTYTVSFWSQAKNGRWGNTLLFTLGTNEADLKRTVNYGAGSYTATSNTSGSSLGAMWELTYDFHPVKDNKSNILQPLFNVAVMHTSMDGFSEKNAGNVGLAAEKQTRDTVTLGLGLRWLAAINSAKAVNRTVSTEVHANVAQDMGDRRSVANVALLADPNFTQSVYGSKTGSTAFQFGAGVNVPVTPNSQIYVNAGGELREHANAWNAALGVRMGF